MTSDDLNLYVSSAVRDRLLNLLSVSLELGQGASVIDHVGADPWGDLAEFRRCVYDPLHGNRTAPLTEEGLAKVTVPASDVEPLRAVVDGLSESYSGGVPWVTLDERERSAVNELIAALDNRGTTF